MNPVALVILDGWGYSARVEGNAIMQAETPVFDGLYDTAPWALLDAAGEAVGLPVGQMGNSEVGHLNIGSGRIVYQELTRINRAIKTGEFFQNPVLLEAFRIAGQRSGDVHLLGLVSDGGVHSHLDHLVALLETAKRSAAGQVFVHAILDGRDTHPACARPYLEKLTELSCRMENGRIATVIGRFYSMDRDRRWDRTERAYRAYARGEGILCHDPVSALEAAYARGETDEFVQPVVICDGGRPLATFKQHDSIIFFNFRPDRARQISRAFVDSEFDAFDRGPSPPLPHYVTLTEYDRGFSIPVAFPPDYLEGTLGEVISSMGLSQLRIAETEKYAHVTSFFNGGREKPFTGEERILVPSPPVSTYDRQPEMSAPGVTTHVLEALDRKKHKLLVVNYANADMVGHTGDFEAAIRAVQAVDLAVGQVHARALAQGWRVVICGDHGNAEQMLFEDGGIHTAHTTNPVPFFVLGDPAVRLRRKGILADVAPTILDLAGLPPSPAMTGKSMLLER